MPQGLQVWDANGVSILDTNSRVSRVKGVISLAANASGSISVPKLSTEAVWATLASSNTKTRPASQLTIGSQSGTSVTVSYTLGPAAAQLIYGVY